MCLLILIRGVDADYPLLVASNRDEHRERKAAPPGLWVGESRRILSPRDRRAGGTWMGVNAAGMFAGITNVAGAEEVELPTSRGALPHLALDQESVPVAIEVVRDRCAAEAFNPFQLLIADRDTAAVIVSVGEQVESTSIEEPLAVLTNEHRLGELSLTDEDVAFLLSPGVELEDRIQRLQAVLVDEGARTGHRILKKGGDYGTVSSSVVAIPAADMIDLRWWYAAGEPGVVAYRNYGNLARRLEG